MSDISGQFKNALTSLTKRNNDALLSTTEAQLREKYYFFQWEDSHSIEWNTYQFSSCLEIYKNRCRAWEEHHNGSCCVAERVRDKYLMPVIKEFLMELNAHVK